MTMKKILITGLSPAATEENLRTWLSRFGPVARVEIVREGSANDPVALVHMEIGDAAAAYMVSRLSGYWHEGSVLSAQLLHH